MIMRMAMMVQCHSPCDVWELDAMRPVICGNAINPVTCGGLMLGLQMAVLMALAMANHG